MDSIAPNTRPSPAGFGLTRPSSSQRRALEGALSGAERRVLLNHGTEARFCGGLLADRQAGCDSHQASKLV